MFFIRRVRGGLKRAFVSFLSVFLMYACFAYSVLAQNNSCENYLTRGILYAPFQCAGLNVINNQQNNSVAQITSSTGDISTTGGLDVSNTSTFRTSVCLGNAILSGCHVLATSSGTTKLFMFGLNLPASRCSGVIDITYIADIYKSDGVTLFHPEIFTARYVFFQLSAGATPVVKNVSNVSSLSYYYNETGSINTSNSYSQIATPDSSWTPATRRINFYYLPPTNGYIAKNGFVLYVIYWGPAGVSSLSVT